MQSLPGRATPAVVNWKCYCPRKAWSLVLFDIWTLPDFPSLMGSLEGSFSQTSCSSTNDQSLLVSQNTSRGKSSALRIATGHWCVRHRKTSPAVSRPMAQMAAWHRWLCRRKELVEASPRSPSYASSSSDESVPPQRVWADVRRRALGNLETCGTFHVALRCWNKFEHVWFWSVELCPWTGFLDVCRIAGVLRVISWQAGTSLKDHAAGALIRSVAATILALLAIFLPIAQPAGRELGVSLCCVDAGWDRIDLDGAIICGSTRGRPNSVRTYHLQRRRVAS